jgi:hypothetical protein
MADDAGADQVNVARLLFEDNVAFPSGYVVAAQLNVVPAGGSVVEYVAELLDARHTSCGPEIPGVAGFGPFTTVIRSVFSTAIPQEFWPVAFNVCVPADVQFTVIGVGKYITPGIGGAPGGGVGPGGGKVIVPPLVIVQDNSVTFSGITEY